MLLCYIVLSCIIYTQCGVSPWNHQRQACQPLAWRRVQWCREPWPGSGWFPNVSIGNRRVFSWDIPAVDGPLSWYVRWFFRDIGHVKFKMRHDQRPWNAEIWWPTCYESWGFSHHVWGWDEIWLRKKTKQTPGVLDDCSGLGTSLELVSYCSSEYGYICLTNPRSWNHVLIM